MKFLLIVLTLFLSGCSILGPSHPLPMTTYVLSDAMPNLPVTPKTHKTLSVSIIGAPEWLNTQQMAYSLKPDEVSYFAEHEWAAAPQILLQPIIVHAISQSQYYRAVISAPTNATVDESLDIKLLHMQQNFWAKPSQYQITLQLVLTNEVTNKPIASTLLNVVTQAPSDNPDGGVQAANSALAQLLPKIIQFCQQNG